MNPFIAILQKSPLLLGAAGTLVINALGAVLVLGTHYLLARVLGPDGLGNYSYALSWVSLVSLVAVLGVDSVVVAHGSRLSKSPERLRGLFTWAARDVLLGTILATVLYLSIILLGKWNLPVMLAAAPLILFLAAGLLRQSMLRALKRPALARFPDVVLRPALFAIAIVTLVLKGSELGPGEALLLHAGAALCAFAVGVVLVRAVAPYSKSIAISKDDVITWRRSASGFFLLTWAGVTFQELDMLISGSMLGGAVTGLYATALRLAALVPFAAQACDFAFAPLISEKFSAGQPIQGLARRAVIWNVALGVFPTALLLLFGEQILGVFGDEFKGGATILTTLSVGQFLALLMGPGGFTLSMTNNHLELAKIYTIWTVLALVAGVACAHWIASAEFLAVIMATCLFGRAIHAAILCKLRLDVNVTCLSLLKN